MIQIRNVKQSIVLHKGSPAVTVISRPSQSIQLKTSGPQGPKGATGDQGIPGPIGDMNGEVDLPDLILLFENALV
jgi:hypothetical protein